MFLILIYIAPPYRFDKYEFTKKNGQQFDIFFHRNLEIYNLGQPVTPSPVYEGRHLGMLLCIIFVFVGVLFIDDFSIYRDLQVCEK